MGLLFVCGSYLKSFSMVIILTFNWHQMKEHKGIALTSPLPGTKIRGVNFPPPPTSQRLLRLTVTVFNFYASWLPFFESVLRFTVNSNETLLVGKLCCRRILNLLSKVFSATIFSIPFSSGLRLVKDVL